MRLRACLTSIMRTYYTWQFVDSSDKSHEFGRFGLWSAAELAVGIITGCLPVMPKFIQHIGSKFHTMFSTQSMPASNSGHDPRSRPFNFTTFTSIKSPFINRSTGLSTSDADTHPYAQPHGEYCMLDEFGASQHQKGCNLIPTPGGGATTKQDDLEYGRQAC